MDAPDHALSKLEQTDAALQALGVAPAALTSLLEHYLGGVRISAQRADELLSTLSNAAPEPFADDDFEVVVDDDDDDEPSIELELDVDDE
ncbi:MAG: hypothetical protein RL701_2721 [Pseudomonadota bacterium]